MYNEGKQVLRQHIKRKRASEGLPDETLEDLFAKKPRHELSEEEYQMVMLRRQKNKEAAERSRKKKKVEMEKLQSENDQLNQDKCELVAMVQKLENDINIFSKENDDLRTNLDHLKRWIGKRGAELGLTRYTPNDAPPVKIEHGDLTPPSSTRGSPPPPSCTPDPAEELVTESGNRRSSSPEIGKEVGLERAQPAPRSQLLTPWLVDEPVAAEKPTVTEPRTKAPLLSYAANSFAQLSENHPVVMATKQQVLYLPKDAIIVIQDDQAAVTGPSARPVVVASPKLAVEPPTVEVPYSSSRRSSLDGNRGKDAGRLGHNVRGICTESTAVRIDTDTATAVESLLRLG